MLQVPPSEIVTVDRSDGRTLDERFYITPCLLQVAVTGGHEYALTISRDPVSGMLRPTV